MNEGVVFLIETNISTEVEVAEYKVDLQVFERKEVNTKEPKLIEFEVVTADNTITAIHNELVNAKR
ncbi:hypothetical protein CEQ21_23865 [Niallia circulans]|uniref:Uncharacterized protein n=1 Tax=Niallia circulans TaxID=1397 RepID=A0A553SN57_NIACI|nr:hypothetical protein [Niallia circulans]TRZ38431.1 hypothetical protein CEQ21_23865 [Niallia circulans]